MARKHDKAVVESLATIPLFSECSTRELRDITRSGKVVSKSAGSTIVAEGTGGGAFFSILDGQVEITRGDKRLAVLMPGDFFGEMALLVDTSRNASATALTDVECFAITAWHFKSLLLGDAKLAYKTARAVAARASTT